jgi:hypothetical protein
MQRKRSATRHWWNGSTLFFTAALICTIFALMTGRTYASFFETQSLSERLIMFVAWPAASIVSVVGGLSKLKRRELAGLVELVGGGLSLVFIGLLVW